MREFSKARGLIAGLTCAELGIDFATAYELTSDVDDSELATFETQLWDNSQQKIVFASKNVTVLDSYRNGGDDEQGDSAVDNNAVATRSLIFNSRPDLVQSSSFIDRQLGRVLSHLPPPRHGEASTEVQGLGLSIALRSQLTKQDHSGEKQVAPKVLILGAGAGTLAAFLCVSTAAGNTPGLMYLRIITTHNLYLSACCTEPTWFMTYVCMYV